MALLAAILALLLAQEGKPNLIVRVYPPMTIAPLGVGCAMVRLTAEIRGPETPEWYCPEVKWTWPDDTVSTEESDCPPFEERHRVGWRREGGRIVDEPAHGFPRRWVRDVCFPAAPTDDPWIVTVELARAGRVFAKQYARVTVR